MKQFFSVFALLITLQVAAQTHVQDKEQLFTKDEVYRLDSMLQQYHQLTDKIVLIATDSSEVNNPSYKNELFQQYFPDSTSNKWVLMLLMSRKSQTIMLVVSKPLLPYISQQLLMDIIETGILSIKDKRREEGAAIICKKAMEFLNGLQKKN